MSTAIPKVHYLIFTEANNSTLSYARWIPVHSYALFLWYHLNIVFWTKPFLWICWWPLMFVVITCHHWFSEVCVFIWLLFCEGIWRKWRPGMNWWSDLKIQICWCYMLQWAMSMSMNNSSLNEVTAFLILNCTSFIHIIAIHI